MDKPVNFSDKRRWLSESARDGIDTCCGFLAFVLDGGSLMDYADDDEAEA
jgi:hypothetical protein